MILRGANINIVTRRWRGAGEDFPRRLHVSGLTKGARLRPKIPEGSRGVSLLPKNGDEREIYA